MADGPQQSPYAGEGAEITVTVDDFDGVTALTSSDLTVTVEIRNPAGSVIVGPTAMTWDAVRAQWFYIWDTTAASATLVYTARIVATDHAGVKSAAFKRIQLRLPPY